MNTMNREEVIEYIESLAEAAEKELYDSWKTDGYFAEDELSSFDCIKCVDDVGGEGEGTYRHLVFSVDREGYDTTYIKYQGQYDSWNGTEWDDDNFTVVRPVEKTIIVYE